MTLHTRLTALEPRQPRRCETCASWNARVIYDDGAHTDWQGDAYPTPPAACPDCGRVVLTVNVLHVDGDEWQRR